MCLSTSDLGGLVVAQVVDEQAAFGLDHEIEAFVAVDFDKHRPIGIVGAQRRRHFEPPRKLGVDFHRLVFFELLGEGSFDAAGIINDVLEDRLLRVLQHVPQITCQLLLRKQLLRIVVLVADALVFDPIDNGQSLGAVDHFACDLDEGLWVGVAENPRLPSGPARDMRAFLLNGFLFYRPPARQLLSFQACRISAKQRRLLGRLNRRLAVTSAVAHADWRTEGFVFSLASAVHGGKGSAGAGLADALADAERDSRDAISRIRALHLAMETCMGFWLPRPYAAHVEDKVSDVASSRRERLADFAGRLMAAKDTRLRDELGRHVSDLRALFRSHGQDVETVPDLDGAFARFLSSRRELLSSDEALDRLSRPLVLTEMPDIWSDAAASRRFELSFCDDLGFRLARPGRRQHIVAVLEDAIEGLDGDADDAGIRTALEAHLASAGWDDRDWPEP